MADVTITAVALGPNAQTEKVKFGEAAPVGSSVYLDTTDGTWKKADANAGAVQAGGSGIGVVVNKIAAAGEYGVIATSGLIYIDTGLTKGTTYIVSGTAGGIAPDTDGASGWFKTVLGVAGAEGSGGGYDELILNPIVSGYAIA